MYSNEEKGPAFNGNPIQKIDEEMNNQAREEYEP